MSQRAGDGEGRSGQDGLPPGAGDGAKGGQQLPPELLEALGEALNGEDFKRTLDQIGKQLGKDMNQVHDTEQKESALFGGGGVDDWGD